MLSMLVVLAGCGWGQPERDHQQGHDHDHAHDQDHAHDAAPEGRPAIGLALSLNGGVAWAMDEHTRIVLGQTRSTLAGAPPTTVEEAHALAGTLQEQLDRLIQGCTMDGAAHDELHVFLASYIPAVTALQETRDAAAVEAQVVGLRAMVAEADRVFE